MVKEISDEQPLTEGKDLSVVIAGLPEDIVRVGLASTDFITKGVKVGHSLVIEGAGVAVAGSYQIIKVAPRGTGVTESRELQVEPAPSSSFSNLSYKIVDELDINLNEPKNMRETGSDLKAVMGSRQVSTVSEVDFLAVGGQVGDTLRVTSDSANAGDYGVQQITGTGNKLMVLDGELRRTSDSEPWQLFNKQAGIQLPLLRIKTIDLLDSSLNPTGETLPYADPVDIQSSAFSNAGVGLKKAVADAKVGIIGTVDLSGGASALNGKQIQISVNNAPAIPVNFSGVTTLQTAVDQINAITGLSGIAQVYTIGAAQYLAIRSTTRWLQVTPYGSANSTLGLSTSVSEESRQVTSTRVSDRKSVV